MGKKSKYSYSLKETEDDVWTVDSTDEHQCKKYKEAKKIIDTHQQSSDGKETKIHIGGVALQKIQTMCIMLSDTEFLVYLLPGCKICTKVKTEHDADSKCKFVPDERFVADVYVPKQEVGWASVEMEGDENIPQGIIVALHKPPGDTNPSFSCTDDEKLNVNHDMSIVISQSGRLDHWHGTVLEKQPCGCKSRVKADITFKILTADIKEAIEKRVKKTSYVVSSSKGGNGGSWYEDPDYECGYCQKMFKSYKARRDHEKDAHKITDDEIKESYGMH